MRDVSTDEPCGFGIVGEDSRRVILLVGWRFVRERAVETGVDVSLSQLVWWMRLEGKCGCVRCMGLKLEVGDVI
jgi:hypothetical protein